MTNNTLPAFTAAVEAAYSSECTIVSPAVRYSPARGWIVESAIHPVDHDCVFSRVATLDANSGKMSIGGRSESAMARDWNEICEQFEISN